MFFEAERIPKFRRMILSDTVEQREAALAELLPYQREDFIGMYKALRGRPMTVRFLDPPLHEFLPKTEAEMRELGDSMGLTYAVKKEMNYDIVPEIMVPLTGERKELLFVKNIIVETAEQVMKEQGYFLNYQVGTMIEIPRAALTADDVAKEADFFSFGTNDLTQMTFGFSRDDAGKFLESYYDQKIYEFDPFSKLDQTGVGQLMQMAVKKGRQENPMLHCGICGEHGGDPSSVAFCQELGLDYVSCSPFRVPIARLAAAQAAINLKKK